MAMVRRQGHRLREVASKNRWQLMVLLAGFAAIGVALYTREWMTGAGLVVLGATWFTLRDERIPPVLPLAVTFQWVQITAGLYYHGFTGRPLEAIASSDYRRMVLLGLGCLAALVTGLVIGRKLVSGESSEKATARFALRWNTLVGAYFGSLFLAGFIREIAWQVPGLTQAALAIANIHLGVVFLMFRRLVFPRFKTSWFVPLLTAEVVMGFTGYFAGFREPMALAGLAILEQLGPSSKRQWIRLGVLGAAACFAAVLWISVRGTYRQEIDEGLFGGSRTARAQRVGELSNAWMGSNPDYWGDVDALVDRMWPIYYPALAVQRVPLLLPHTDGAIILAALKHIVTPRFLFPDKPVLPSDSEMVRKYSGINVAGTEQNTSIAFGYAAESYLDFGVPWMFFPSLVFGVVIGVAYRLVFRTLVHRELAIGYASVVFWLSLYLFERSWIKTLGLTFTMFIYLGALVFLLDRFLLRSGRRHPQPRFASSKALVAKPRH